MTRPLPPPAVRHRRRGLAPLVLLAWCCTGGALADRAAAQLLPGEFGDIQLGRELVEPTRFPTVGEMRALAARSEIAPVLMLRLFRSDDNHHLPVWSEDGQGLAFQTSRRNVNSSKLSLFRPLSTPEPLPLTTEADAYDYMFRWAVSGPTSYVFARIDAGRQSTRILFSEAGEPPQPRTPAGAQSFFPAVYQRTDGIRWLAYERDGQVVHQAWQDGQQVERVVARGTSPRWSRDGRRLLLAHEIERRGAVASYGVTVRNLVDNQQIVLPTPTGAVIRSPVWSPDETAVAFYSRVGGESAPWRIEVGRLAGGEVQTVGADVVVNPDFRSEGPSWQPDSQRLWYFSQGHRRQEYYPLVSVSAQGGGVTLIEYPQRCTTPRDAALNPATAIPEVAFVGHDGLTQNLFVVFFNHY